MYASNNNYSKNGFTLIELVITIALAGIVMAIGIPSFQSLSETNHVTSHVDDLKSALRLARHVAVEHDRNAKACARVHTSDPTAAPTCDTSGSFNWGNGWIVALQQTDGTYEAVMTNTHLDDNTSFSVVDSNDTSIALKELVFGPTGTLKTAVGAIVTISIGSCSRTLTMTLAGHTSEASSGC